MSIFKRMAIGLAGWLLRRSLGGPPNTEAAAGWFRSMMGGFVRPRTEVQWEKAFGENARLRTPIHCIAEDVAAAPWRLERVNVDKKTGREVRTPIFSHRLLDLMKCPHPRLPLSMWTYMVQVFIDLTGKCPVRMEDFDEQGRPRRLTPFPPHMIIQLPYAKDLNFHVNWWGKPERIPAGEIIYLHRPDPLDPYGDGLGAARSLDDEVYQDEAMGKFNNYYFRHCAFLGAIINVPNADLKELQEEWAANKVGVHNAGRPFFSNAEDGKVSVTNLSPKLRELAFQEGRNQVRDFCLQAFQVPPERAGVLDNSNRSTIEAADFFHQSKNVLPRLRYLREAWNLWLVPLFDIVGNLELNFEDPVKESEEHRRLAAEMGTRTGLLTLDEGRARLGEAPLPNGAGKVLSIPVNNVVLVPAEGDLAASVAEQVQAMAGVPQPSNNGNGTTGKRQYREMTPRQMLDALREFVGVSA